MVQSLKRIQFFTIITFSALFLINCEKDNFPSSPQHTSEIIENDYNKPVSESCSIIIDSVIIDSVIYNNYISFITVHWYGKVKNISSKIVNAGYVSLTAKVYTDSTAKVIITTGSAGVNLAKFKPGESHLFDIKTNYDAIDTTKYPNFYPDSVFFPN